MIPLVVACLVALTPVLFLAAEVRRLSALAREAQPTSVSAPSSRWGAELDEAFELAGKVGTERARVAAHNLLLLELQRELERGVPLRRLAWRIAAAVGVGAALLLAASEPRLALVAAGAGVGCGGAAFFLGRMADHQGGLARKRWNTLIRQRGGSFTNG